MKKVSSPLMKAAEKFWGKPFAMAGTENTGKYSVLAITSRGRVGVRDLGGGIYRIRVEPLRDTKGVAGRHLARNAGWKQPGDQGQPRYSMVVYNGEGLDIALGTTFAALGVGALKTEFGAKARFSALAKALAVKPKSVKAVMDALETTASAVLRTKKGAAA